MFVMDPFSGPAYDHVTSSSKFKCTVVGPRWVMMECQLSLITLAIHSRCLLTCLAQNIPVPDLNYPMFTAAMRGMVISCSNLDKQQKEMMKNLIEKMAGCYSASFHDGVTHLVTNKAMSAKYNVAAVKEVPVMLPSWVEEVWRVSSLEGAGAMEPRFRSHR